MKNGASYWKQLALMAFCAFLVFVSSTTKISADSDRTADPARLSRAVRPAESLLITVDSISGDYEIKGLYAGRPKNVEEMASADISKGAFALVLTETGELFIKPILVRDAGNSKLEVLLPFSDSWYATEITLINVPVSSQASWTLKAISIPGETLMESYARMRNLRAEQVRTKRPGPLIGDCFDTPGGCRLCYFCYEVFGVELCQSPNIYC